MLNYQRVTSTDQPQEIQRSAAQGPVDSTPYTILLICWMWTLQLVPYLWKSLEARILSGRFKCHLIRSCDFTLLSSHYPPQDPWVVLVLSHDLQNLVRLTVPPLALFHVVAVLRSDIVLRISRHVKTSLGRHCILETLFLGTQEEQALTFPFSHFSRDATTKASAVAAACKAQGVEPPPHVRNAL